MISRSDTRKHQQACRLSECVCRLYHLAKQQFLIGKPGIWCLQFLYQIGKRCRIAFWIWDPKSPICYKILQAPNAWVSNEFTHIVTQNVNLIYRLANGVLSNESNHMIRFILMYHSIHSNASLDSF